MRIIIFLALLLLWGCATSIDVTKLDATTVYPRTNQVDIYTDKASVNRAYKEIAILSGDDQGNDHSDSSMIEDIKKKAQEIGADAIILTGRDSVSDGGVLVYGSYIASNRKIIRVIAIKYLN